MKQRSWRSALSVAAVTMALTIGVVVQERATGQRKGAVPQNAAILQQDEAALLGALYPKERSFVASANAYRVNSRRRIDKKWDDEFLGPYNLVLDWYRPVVEGHKAGLHLATHAAFAESPNRILIAHSGEAPFPEPPANAGPFQQGRVPAGGPRTVVPRPPTRAPIKPGVIVVNGSGEMIENWSQHSDLFVFPHTVTGCPFDPEKGVWVVDREGSVVYKFSNDGKKLLLTLGEKSKPGYDNTHLHYPSDLTCMPDGSIIVADGYVNSRVIKYDKNGKFLTQIGGKDPGEGPGQFNLVHAVAVDKQGRLYVADRGNHRIQIFDRDWKYLSELGVHTPCNLAITQDGSLWVTSCMLSRILKFDPNGKLLYYFGSPNTIGEGGWGNTHNSTIDSDGNFYVVDESAAAVHKLVPKPNADKSRLVGQPYT